ncbi:hypothetical protein BLD48_01340 [Exiguobacterium sp. KRL4]|uniref:hypothetical protein n=1 Tax=Exiguobacterium sp. KRL4 TaxID=1914536 RepID=UPI0008F86DCA|nr:hypothetical protein [Exiguobacterium sp. KRL4]OIN68169.1 hypothetical protein BLD48_01340 [Exiguobacterium sp. KRL4]
MREFGIHTLASLTTEIDDMTFEEGGDSFFTGMPVFMVIFFVLIISVIVISLISAASKGISTNGITQKLRHHASQLVTPSESGAQDYLTYMRSLSVFPIDKTNLEPVRLAKGILALIQQTDLIEEITKQDILAQYTRLGLLEGDPLADEQTVRRHSSVHHDQHQIHMNQHHTDHPNSNHSNF